MDGYASPDLPEDILRLIVDSFAVRFDKNDVLRLLPVSRNVKAWVEPRVYSKVVLKSSKQVIEFAAALRGDFTFSHPSGFVKLLWLLCSDLTATQHLSSISEQCPNLLHFAFYGRKAPFCSTLTGSSERPHLTRLSICSPLFLNFATDMESAPIQWERLTHLHVLGLGDILDAALYLQTLGLEGTQLKSLEHLCIELTYPSPETANFIHLSDLALYWYSTKEGIILQLFERLPRLRKVVFKTNFTYTGFRASWDDFRARLKGMPRVVFEMKPLPNQDFYESALLRSSLSEVAWQTLLNHAFDEIDQLWTNDD